MIISSNIGVLTRNKVATQDLPEVREKNIVHEDIMKNKTKGEPVSIKNIYSSTKAF